MTAPNEAKSELARAVVCLRILCVCLAPVRWLAGGRALPGLARQSPSLSLLRARSLAGLGFVSRGRGGRDALTCGPECGAPGRGLRGQGKPSGLARSMEGHRSD